MRTLAAYIIALVILPLPAANTSASAAVARPSAALSGTALSDLVEVKKGGWHHGWGRSRGHGGGPPGWRGRHCPPGHWKKGWC
jgi:hypothetical protein